MGSHARSAIVAPGLGPMEKKHENKKYSGSVRTLRTGCSELPSKTFKEPFPQGLASSLAQDAGALYREDSVQTRTEIVQGILFPNKISGVGTIFGLLVHVLPGPNKQRPFEQRTLLS